LIQGQKTQQGKKKMNKQIVVVSLIALALCGIIGQVANATFARVSKTTGASGEGDFYGTATDGQDVYYVSTDPNPYKLVKYSGATNERVGAASMTGITSVNGGVTYCNGNVYAGDWGSNPAKIAKVATSTMTLVGSLLSLTAGEYYVYALETDGSTFLYVALYSNHIVKVKLSDFTRVGVVALASGENYPYALSIDSMYLYVALDQSSGNPELTRIILSSFKEDTSVTFESGEDDPYTVLADSTSSVSTYVYVGLDVSPGIIVKVSVSTWARVSAVTVNSADSINDMTFDTARGMIYAVTDSNPFAVVQVKVSDLSTVTTLVGDLEETSAYYIRRVGDNSVFVGTDVSPATSVKYYIDGPPPAAPNATAPLSVGAAESKIVVAVLIALISVVFVMA